MLDTESQFQKFASQVSTLCSHVSVQHDDNGPYIFALGLKETHTLQMRKINKEYVLELWYGATSDDEFVASIPSYLEINEALFAAKNWLEKDSK